MNAENFSSALGKVNDKYIMEAVAYKFKKKSGRLKWGTMAACFGLILSAAMITLPGILKEPISAAPPPDPDIPVPVTSDGNNQSNTDPLQPPDEQNVMIDWDSVAVNEVEQLKADAALRYYDPALYDKETWSEAEIIDYFGWIPAPDYIPEGLTGSGNALSGIVIRSKESGELVQDQIGRGFWSSFYEDGSPKSDDGIPIPTGFTLTASKLGILHCGILPAEETKATHFGSVPVTLIHCSMPHGPFDPDSYAPNGLYHTPAGYYDVYQAAFEVKGVQYEITAQRLELKEVVKIVASVVSGISGENLIVQ